MAQQKFRIEIPKDFTPSERERLAEKIITFIQERTSFEQKGFNPKTGRNYSLSNKPYTEQYADKKGVSEDDVDLTLSSDMLAAIELLNHRSGSITVGYSAGSKENAKAEGNQIGSYGKPQGDPSKARPFLGLTKADLRRIIDDGI